MVYILSLVHGLFNIGVLALFVYEGSLGFRIRRSRQRQIMPPPVSSIRRHRKNGPLFVILGVVGFLIGFVLVAATTGRRIVVFRSHFWAGLTVVALLLANYGLTRKIKRPVSPFRTPHFVLGLLLLAAYAVQTVLGLRILLG
jgi:hypothetical protein